MSDILFRARVFEVFKRGSKTVIPIKAVSIAMNQDGIGKRLSDCGTKAHGLRGTQLCNCELIIP